MKNILKKIAEKSVENAFTNFAHYQPKMPKSLMVRAMCENKKD